MTVVTVGTALALEVAKTQTNARSALNGPRTRRFIEILPLIRDA
jgi:hypothetical protein